MSVDRALTAIDTTVQAWSTAAGQSWTPGLAKKVGFLNAMEYWDPADRARFETDYEFLRSQIRRNSS